MSNQKSAIQEIKSLMVKFGFMKSESFVDAKLIDGTVIKVEGEALASGAKVMVITEEGEFPAPDGVHELEDGTKVETKDGLIAQVMSEEEKVEEEKPEVKEEEMEDVPVEVEVEVPAEVAAISEPVVSAIVEAIVPVLEEIKSLSDEMKKMKEQMNSVESDFNSFKKEPAGKKISDGKTDFNKQVGSNDGLENKLEFLKALRANN
jgi:hypothetical protein